MVKKRTFGESRDVCVDVVLRVFSMMHQGHFPWCTEW